MAWKFANKSATQRFEDEDGNWIEVRAEISKGEHADLTRDMVPNLEGRTVDDFYKMQNKFFKLVMVNWSLVNEAGEPIPVSLQAYNDLDTEASNQIDEWLNNHMRDKFNREVDELEGEVSS